MKNIIKHFLTILTLAIFCTLTTFAKTNLQENMKSDTITIIVKGGKTFTATLSDNSSAKALKELLKDGNITIKMSDYASMEKVGPLGKNLPRNDEPIKTTAGDIILYQGNNLVIYYGENHWSLTRIGKINNTSKEELSSALGKGDVEITLSAD